MSGRFDFLEVGQAPASLEAEAVVYGEGEYLKQALAASERGDFEKSLRLYSRAIDSNPESEMGWLGQLQCLLAMDEPKEAKLWAAKGIEKWPRNAGLIAARAVALARLGESEEAIKASDASMAFKQEDPWVWMARAYVLLWKGETNAEYCFTKALEKDKSNRWLNLQAGGLAMDAGHADMALPYLKAAFEAPQPTPLVFYRLASAYVAMGWSGQASPMIAKGAQMKGELQNHFTALEKQARQGGGLVSWVKGLLGGSRG